MFIHCKSESNNDEKQSINIEVVVNHLEPHKIEYEPCTLNIREKFTINPRNYDCGLIEIVSFDVDLEGNIYLLNRRSQDNK